jgi:hypothetical protein
MERKILDKEKIEKETRTKLQNAIKFLAPWFGLSTDKAVNESKVQRLTLCLVDSPQRGSICYSHIPLIEIPYKHEEDRGDFTIGHEVGHWYHDLINPGFYRYGALESYRSIFKIYCEGIANYSGIIFEHKRNPIQVAGFFDSPYVPIDRDFFSLVNLVRLNSNEIEENRYYLRYFFIDRLAPFIPRHRARQDFLELMERF